MRKKIILSFFIILLSLVLINCSGVIPITPDINQKEEIKEVINNYWLALSNKQYELAKIYCITYGDAYYAIEEYQNLFDYDYITLNWILVYNWVEIIGSNAIVNVNITLIATVCFEDICSSSSETINNFSVYLIKIDNIWKLK